MGRERKCITYELYSLFRDKRIFGIGNIYQKQALPRN